MTAERKKIGLVLAALSACLGCAPELDLPSEIKGLRVLAVQKSAPYAKPGEGVALRMLWHDGQRGQDGQRRTSVRPSIWWISGCVNPPGDLYYGCFAQLAEQIQGFGSGSTLGFAVNTDVFEYTLPTTILDRPRPLDPTQPPYGIAYVFFATCMGELGFAEPSEELSFPITCKGPSGETLGTGDFVAGFTAIYAYDDRDGRPAYRNQNPQITGFRFKDQDLGSERFCVGAACRNNEPIPFPESFACDQNPFLCVDRCPDDGDENCPGTAIQPIVPESSAEVDQISFDTRGRDYREQAWINYYVDRGGVKSEARLFSDAVEGPISDYGTLFRAPKEPGPVNIIAVVHDNRGGVEWVQTTIVVE